MKPQLQQFYTYLLTEKCVAANTFSAYKTDLDQFVKFLEDKKITDTAVTNKEVKEFLYHLNQLQISARTMSRKISALKSFFSYLHERFALPDLGLDLIFPKLEKRLPQYLSEQEVELLLAIAAKQEGLHSLRNKVMLSLLYVTGMRITELTSLCVSDVHFDTGYLSVLGKGGKHRMIPLPAPILPLLREYLEKTPHNKGGQHLFSVVYGNKIKPITRQAFWGILNQLWKKTGIQRQISPHQLRHSLATHLLKRGADLRSLQFLLGHENVSTVEIYTHIETSHLRNVYNKKHPRS